MRFQKRTMAIAALGAVALSGPAAGQSKIERITNNPKAVILQGAKVKTGAELFFLSGQLPSPIDTTKTMADIKSFEDLGDTKTQTISTLSKIKELLEANGYKMTDLVKLTLFVAPDPKTGRLDFAGANAGFQQFFNTAENPTTVARSTVEVKGLVGPYFLIEIEAIAAK